MTEPLKSGIAIEGQLKPAMSNDFGHGYFLGTFWIYESLYHAFPAVTVGKVPRVIIQTQFIDQARIHCTVRT